MVYLYECEEEKCKAYGKTVEVNKSMNESGREEHCEECGKIMKRVYTAPTVKPSGDSIKY